MTESLLSLLGGNSLSAAILFLAALAIQRFATAPAVRHLAWAAVIARLLVPPVLSVPLAFPGPGAGPDAGPATVREPAALGAMAATPAFEPGPWSATPVLPIADPTTGPVADPTTGPTVVPPDRRLSVDPLGTLATVELIGAALFLLLAAVRWTRFRRLLNAARPASPALVEQARSLAGPLGVKRVPRLLVTDERVSPLLVGGLRTAILLPSALLERLPPRETDAVIAHELAHVRRRDAWLRPLEMLATALYWWFPLLPAARRRMRDAEEAACDALVVRALPHLRRAYARGLLETVEFLSGSPGTPSFATGAADARNLKERIVHILKPGGAPSPLRRPVPLTALAIALAVVSLTPGWSRVDAAVREDAAIAPAVPVAPEALPTLPTAPDLSVAPVDLPVVPVATIAPVALPLALAAVESAPEPPHAPHLPHVPAGDLASLRSQLDARRAEMEIHRRLLQIEEARNDLDRSLSAAQQERELARLQAELEVLAQSGEKEAAEQMRRDYEELKRHMELEQRLGAREYAIQAEMVQLELKRAEIDMRRDEMLLAGDETAAETTEAEALQRKAQELQLSAMLLQMERAEAELEIQRARYDELMRQMEQEGK